MSKYFHLFSPEHFLLIGLSFFCCLLVAFLPKKLDQKIRLSIVCGLILQVFLFHFWHFWQNTYDLERYLPLHLCSISIYLVIIALLTKNNFVQQLIYYWALVPAFLALVFPDIGTDTPLFSFRVFEFYLSHILIVIGTFYLIFVTKTKLNYRNIWLSFLLLLILAMLIYPINLLLGANYLYLMQKPQAGGPMDFLGVEPWHLLSISGIMLIIWHLQFWLANRNRL